MGNGPVFKARNKGIEVTVWKNTNSKSVNIRKSYKDKKTDEWKESKSFFEDDLVILKNLLTETIDWFKKGPKKEKIGDVSFDDDDIPF